METALSSVVKRLEAATQRLEEIANRSTGGNDESPSASGSGVKADGEPKAVALIAFDDLLSGNLSPYLSLSTQIGGVVSEQAEAFKQAIDAQRHIIAVALKSKKPDNTTLQGVIAPLQSAISKIVQIRDKSRTSPLFNHLSAVSEGVPALGWIVVEPAPGPFAGEMRDAAQFYANRVIKEFKEKDKLHVEWSNTFVAFLTELQNYVKKHHTTGLAWNPRGRDVKEVSASTPATASTANAASAPSPAAPAASTAGAQAGLFSALNKEGLTSGLRKVDKAEMTHKNPELRAAGVVKSTETSAAPKASLTSAAAKPPKMALEGSKWVVENQNNNQIVIDQTELRHVVYIYNCQNSTIQIKGKVNAVTIDGSKKVGVVVENVVSTIDVVNVKSSQVQITGKAPTLAVDKTDGLQVYLGKEAHDIEILSAKSSEMNVLIQQADDEYIERPLPEQFKTTIVNGVLTTVPVEHKG